MTGPIRLFLVAGETSGDRLGALLIHRLRERTGGGLEVNGVGGPMMRAAGLTSLFPMEDLSVMGLTDVLVRLPSLLRRLRETAEAVERTMPHALITIDSPDFNLRLAIRARRRVPGLRIVHYVAPTVWAWRPGRARRMVGVVDHILALLPFEPAIFRGVGIRCDFVGHPAIQRPDAAALREAQEDVQARWVRPGEDVGFRNGAGLTSDDECGPVVLLPGSRAGEIRRMGPVFEGVVRRIATGTHQVTWLVLAAAPVVDEVRNLVREWPGNVVVMEAETGDPEVDALKKHAVFSMAKAAFATSGTVVLELASAGCPMVIGYRAGWLTSAMVRRMATIDSASLVNLLVGRQAIPEFLFDDCTPETVAPALTRILESADERTAQRAVFKEAMDLMGAGCVDPVGKAAESVLDFLNNSGCRDHEIVAA